MEANVAGLVRAGVEEFGRLDGAFNNAGGVSAFAPVPDVDERHWHAELEQNLTGVFYGLKYQIPAIRAAGGGAVVNNAAVAGAVGVGTMAPYVAAKHGVVGLTRATAMECAAAGVRVNALITGTVDTPLFRPSAHAEDATDLCYVRDCGRAIALLMLAERLNHRIYNVSSGRLVGYGEVVDAINATVPGTNITLPPGRSPDRSTANYLDITRLREDTGFQPEYDVERTVQDYADWLKKHGA